MTTAQDTPSIGELLRQYRRERELSKAQMYRALDISPGTYDYWEGETYIPGDEHVEILAELLDRSVEEILMTLYKDRLRKRRSPDVVVPLNLDLGRRQYTRYVVLEDATVRADATADWDGRPIEIYGDDERLRAA